MNITFFAIDPGKSAGICLLKMDGWLFSGPVDIGSPYDLVTTRRQIEEHTPHRVVMEAVAWRASAFRRCPKLSGGILIGALGLQNLPLGFVGPGTWRKRILGDSKASKQAAIDWVQETYGFTPADHNEAEAVCMATYAADKDTTIKYR